MKRQMRWSVIFLGIVLISGLVVARIVDPVPLQSLRSAYFDYLQRLDPRDYQDLPVRVVDIDETSLARYGQWPWPRDLMAQLVDRLTEAEAAVIAFDVLFAEPDRYSPRLLLEDAALRALLQDDISEEALQTLDNDDRFARAMSGSAVILGVASAASGGMAASEIRTPGLVEIGNSPRAGLYLFTRSTTLVPQLADAALGFGNINTAPGLNDGTIRQVPLLWRTETSAVASLGLEALRVAFGESTMILRGVGTLEGAVASIQLGGLTIPTTTSGEIWVRYRHDDPRLYISAVDVLDAENAESLQQAVQGRIILVGTSAAGLLDIRTTALGESVPGVSIHAQMIEQILLEDHLTRSDLVVGLEIITQALLGLLVAFAMARTGPTASLLVSGVAAAGIIAASWLMFQHHAVLVDATYPILGGALSLGLLTAFRFVVTDREKRMIRTSFSQYLAPSVLSEIEDRGFKIELGGEMRELTVMFTDIRNFTPLSESMPADALVPLLNDLFTGLSQEILDFGGTIDKFIGDSVMAFWNAPLNVADHSRQAALAALGMRDAMAKFLATRTDLEREIEIGIGLHAGEACVGNIGSRQRFNYSAIGNAVNVAARVESSCKIVGFDIVASGTVHDAAPDLAWLPLGSVALKGVGQRQALFALVGGAQLALSDAFKAMATRHADLLDAINNNQSVTDDLEACKAAAAMFMSRLVPIYERLPERFADIRGVGDRTPQSHP